MSLILILCLYTLALISISCAQILFLKKERAKAPIILDASDYVKSANIAIENEKFSIFSSLYSLVIKILWLSFGFLWLKSIFIDPANSAVTSSILISSSTNAAHTGTSLNLTLDNTLFLLAFLLISSVLNLPLSYYESFIKDKKQGFSTLTLATFIKDTLKSLVLTALIGFVLLFALVFCYEFLGAWWWLAAFGVALCVALIANILYPTLIAPLFNQMSPLDDERLRDQISALMQRCGFQSSGVFVMDASKRDKRLNAYFGGLFKSKRVVLFDTLLKALGTKELLAVLGHELGHFVHKDLLKMLLNMALMLFLLFFIFAHLPAFFYTQAHLDGVSAGVFALLFIFGDIVSFLLSPLINAQSRRNEFAADAHGAALTSKEDMQDALLCLAKENKAFVKTSKIYELFHLSHPSISERLDALEHLK